jgi:hypothetical protein
MDATGPSLETELNAQGCAVLPELLSREACAEARKWWTEESLFRSRVDMARHGFGQGEYRYFAYPLPDRVAKLREQLYPSLLRSRTAGRSGWGRTGGFRSRMPRF